MRSTPRHSAVFVDPSGRRRKLARRGALLLAVPLVGYVVLLVSTVLGGPTMHTPLLPVPDAIRHPGNGQSTLEPGDRPAAHPTPEQTVTPASPTTASTSPTSGATPGAAGTGTPSAAATTVPTSTVVPTNGNRPTAPPGQNRQATPTTPKAPGHTNSPTAKPTKPPG